MKTSIKSLNLPKPIATYFAADKNDSETLSQCFTENAVVKDETLAVARVPSEGWSLWSDSHRRMRVYKTRPVATEAQRQNGVHGRNCTCDLHLRTVAL